jgi:HD-GYP domain-containing protein (c-di-GMP phosphodiesterase class II)
MMFLMFYAYQNYKNNSIRESIDFIENVNNLIDQSKYLENYNELKSFLGKNDIFQKRIRGYYFILNKKNVPLEEYGNCENRRITEEIKDAIIKNDEEKLEKLKNDNIDMLMFNVKPNNELIGVLCLLTDLKNRNEFYMNINRVIENHIYYLTENIELKDKLKNDLSLTVETVLSLIEAKDPINRGHIRRVAYYSYMLGKSLEFSKDELENLRFSSLLYDIGKIEVPDNILKKEGALTDVEYKEIKRHPLIGYNLLKNIDEFKDILTGVLQHHERINGSGYPFGLRGDEISIQAKIIGIIDVFDAITSRRPYRGALSANFALRYLKKNQGRLFDENICSKFIEDIEEGKIKIIRRKDDIFN